MAETPKITREEAMSLLREIHTPKLDAFRAQVPDMYTSDLLAYLTNPDQLMEAILPEDPFEMKKDQELVITQAALGAVAEEIDLRIPRRKP
jgi:hypothetical protein